MTRINLVPPQELADQHLMAEYREITMVPASLRRSLKTKTVEEVMASIPKKFTLNKGHVTFFYNKLAYLHSRFIHLRHELLKRGYKLDLDREFNVDGIPVKFLRSIWVSTAVDRDIVRERIKERIMQKPEFYTYKKQPYVIHCLTK